MRWIWTTRGNGAESRPGCDERIVLMSRSLSPAEDAVSEASSQPLQLSFDDSDDLRVFDLLAYLQRLLQQADGSLHLAQVGVGEAQVAQDDALAPSVADLTGDGYTLLVIA